MSESEKPPSKPPIYFGGSCACGRITYESTSFPKGAQLCHCVTCRKLSGASYQCFPDVISKEVTFYDNKKSLRYEGLPKDSIGGITFLRFSKVGERAFCVDCYSPLAMRYRHEEHVIGLTLGTVDEETIKDEKVKEALKPVAHIFVSQAPWWDSQVGKDGLEAHDRFTAGFTKSLKDWEEKSG